MKRMLFIAMVTVSVTGFVGADRVLAQGTAMSMGSSGGASSGGTGMGSVGGWSLAPEPFAKVKTTATAPSTSGKTAAKSRSPGGGWAMMEADARVTASKPATGGPASAPRATVASNTAADGAAVAPPQKTGEAVRLTREATAQKPASP